MSDSDLRNYYVEQLKKRGLNPNGTLRTLEKRYQEALKVVNESPNEEQIEQTKVSLAKTNIAETSLASSEFSSFWKNSFVPRPQSKPTPNSGQRSTNSRQIENNIAETSTIQEFMFAEDMPRPLKKPEKHFKIYIGNIEFGVKEDQLRELCCSASEGDIAGLHLPSNGVKNEGYAFVFFDAKENGELCINRLHNFVFEGRRLRVEEAHDKNIRRSRMLRQLQKRLRQLDSERRREENKRKREADRKKKLNAKRKIAAAKKKKDEEKEKRNKSTSNAGRKKKK